jgi:hypothetical protein
MVASIEDHKQPGGSNYRPARFRDPGRKGSAGLTGRLHRLPLLGLFHLEASLSDPAPPKVVASHRRALAQDPSPALCQIAAGTTIRWGGLLLVDTPHWN